MGALLEEISVDGDMLIDELQTFRASGTSVTKALFSKFGGDTCRIVVKLSENRLELINKAAPLDDRLNRMHESNMKTRTLEENRTKEVEAQRVNTGRGVGRH